jgi:linoleoyl-CoA desaturase
MGADDLAALQAELRARGYHRRPTVRIVAELAFCVGLAAAGLVMVVLLQEWPLRACGLVLLTLGSLGVGANTHTSSHYATSNRPWLNELLTYFGCSVFLQFSATYWWHKHRIHHRAPNVVGVDGDADFRPLFTLEQDEIDQGSAWRRGYYRWQWLILPVAIAGNAVNMQIAGWRYLLGTLGNRTRRRPAHWIDLGGMVLHAFVWLVVPMSLFAPADVLVLLLVRTVLLSYALFAVFAPAHLPAEAVLLSGEARTGDFFLRQTATTVNFRMGHIGRLFCAGLQYQIEHHLFPGLSHVYYPEASKLVRAYCERRGYPYRTLGWGEALWKALQAFHRPKRVHDLEEVCRTRGAA